MVKDFYRELCEALRDAGFEHLRFGKGSHEIWHHPITQQRVTLCHTKSRYTANQILKQAGIEKRL